MKVRSSIVPFVVAEAAVLMAIVVPVAHARSFAERLLLSANVSVLPGFAPDEGLYILMRSVFMVVALQITFAFRDLYRWNVMVRPQLTMVRLVEGVATVLVVLPLLHYGLDSIDDNFELNGALRRLSIHPILVLAAAGGSFLAAYGLRLKWPRWVKRVGLGERVVIAGHGPAVDVVTEEVHRRHDPGVDLVGFLDERRPPAPGRRVLGAPAEAASVVRQHGVERLVLDGSAALSADTLLAVRLENVKISDIASFHEQVTGRLPLDSLSLPDLFLSTTPRVGMFYVVSRRVLDLLIASLGLLLSLPLCLLAALAIKLESRGPVLYRQQRVGRNEGVFTLAKFRSMRTDAEAASGPVWASGGDARVTRVGHWLRKLRIDEIPQFWSVIRNDMSLVGPRPERPFFVAELARQIPSYGQRHIVKPGVTGWAQINYTYGSSIDDAFIKLQYDLYYIKNRNLALDIAILLRTIKVVVLQQGAV